MATFLFLFIDTVLLVWIGRLLRKMLKKDAGDFDADCPVFSRQSIDRARRDYEIAYTKLQNQGKVVQQQIADDAARRPPESPYMLTEPVEILMQGMLLNRREVEVDGALMNFRIEGNYAVCNGAKISAVQKEMAEIEARRKNTTELQEKFLKWKGELEGATCEQVAGRRG